MKLINIPVDDISSTGLVN